jgi:filamentous hemagglutinin family protein
LEFGGALTLMGGFTSLFFGTRALAQIIPDATLGVEQSVVTPDVNVRGITADRIDGGALRGANLFHSFSQFQVGEGSRVYFANPAGIENILTRVTGNNASNILGTLGVDGTANLFLLNPNGIIFGSKAQLDIAGSFVASTANRLVFENNVEFSASNPEAPPLLTINLRPGLQYGAQPSGTISNAGNLAVGKNLTLAAGNLDLQGQLQAGENLTLEATNTVRVRDSTANSFIARAGGKLLVQGNQGVDIFALNHPQSGFFSGGDMVLRSANPVGGDAHYTSGGSFFIEQLDSSLGNFVSPFDPIIRASGDVNFSSYTGASLHILAGGSVNIGEITITGSDPTGNTINPTTRPLLAYITLSNGRPLIVNGTTQPTLDIRAGTTAYGMPRIIGSNYTTLSPTPNTSAIASTANINVGKITVNAPDGLVFLTNQYMPDRSLSGAIQVEKIDTRSAIGNSSNVIIDSRSNIILPSAGFINATSTMGKAGNITLLAQNAVLANNFIINSSTLGNGEGGNITIKAGSLSLTNGARLIANTYGRSNAGHVNINAADFVLLDGVGSNGESSGAFSEVGRSAQGNGGDLSIITRLLSVTNGAQLSASTWGQGNAGRVRITAGTVSFDGVGSNGESSTAVSRVGNGAEGNGGDLSIISRLLSVTNGAQLSASTRGKGDAGFVTIFADTASFDGVGSNGEWSRATSNVAAGGEGKGGNLSINTRVLSVTNGAQLSASTTGKGNAGNVRIIATDSVRVDGVGTNERSSAISSRVNPRAQGNGGNLSIITRVLSITDGAQVSASSLGQGNAGRVIITATDSISLDGGGSNGRFSGISSRVDSDADGNSGNLWVTTGSLSLNHAGISSSNSGTGRAGNIRVNAQSISLNRGGFLAGTASGQGGNIELDVQDMLLLRNGSFISTTAGTAQAGGNGGNIRINANFIVAVPKEDSNIAANAHEGRGGNINITAQGIFGIKFREDPTPLSDITASSQFGVNGVVQINSPGVDPSRGLTTLPTDLVDPSTLIDDRCEINRGTAASEFTIIGRGGLPSNPNEPLGEESLLEDLGTSEVVRNGVRRGQETTTLTSSSTSPNQLVEAQGWIIGSDGTIILTAHAQTVTPQHPWQTPTSCQAVSHSTDTLAASAY